MTELRAYQRYTCDWAQSSRAATKARFAEFCYKITNLADSEFRSSGRASGAILRGPSSHRSGTALEEPETPAMARDRLHATTDPISQRERLDLVLMLDELAGLCSVVASQLAK